MSSCEETGTAVAADQKRTLRIALTLNAAMFVVGIVAGLSAQSSGLIADALDMLADASAYAIALVAIYRGTAFKARAAGLSGGILLVLGVAVLVDITRRGFFGSSPEGGVMVIVSALSLAVNATVLRLLARVREGGVHLKATWIFTRADVIANLGVLASGTVVWLTGNRYVDLAVGGAIGIYVIKEAFEILGEAREASRSAAASAGRHEPS